MSGKNLTELEWRKFSKGKKLEDKDFVKALAALEIGARAKDAPAQHKALDDIEKQAAKLRSANKADKELLQYLDAADKELALERKQVAMDERKAPAKPAEAGGGEDDEGPAALSTRLLPLLRQVPKAEAPMMAMVAAAGKQVAVLVSNHAIGASQRKLLTGALGSASGIKFMTGDCIWEANAHTFVLEARVAGLAKLIRAALLEQTGARFKVRVRGADPDDVDEDGEDAHEGDAAAAPAGDASAEEALYRRRLAALEPQVAEALRGQVGDIARLQTLLGFARGKAAEGKYAAASQSLELVESLLHAAPAAAPAAAAAAPSEVGVQLTAALKRLTPQIQQLAAAHPERRQELLAAVSEFQAQLKGEHWVPAGQALQRVQALIAGDATRKPARPPARPVAPIWERASERVLEQAMALVLELRGLEDPEADRMADDLLDTLNEHLSAVGETLDEYDAAADDQRADLAGDARDFLREQQSDIDGDPLIAAADDNPFELKLQLRQTMHQALDEIATAFEA